MQRVNSVCALIFGIHWAWLFVAGRARKPIAFLLLAWASYLILSLGSKSGLFTLLTSVGCVASFKGIRINLRHFAVLSFGLIASVTMMFYLFYGSAALASFGIRMMAYADGPFYYFRSTTAPKVSLSYSFDQVLTALRVYQLLPQTSLGPAINWSYFRFDNDLFGPNPQIFVEARAILGVMWPLYYIIVAGVIISILRSARTPYSLALFATVAAPLVIDSQFAMSNVVNVALAYLLKITISVAPKILKLAVAPHFLKYHD